MIRIGYAMAAYAAALGAGASALYHPAPRLIWNASASVPIGFYAVHPVGALQVGELVVIRPPEPLAAFLDRRRYLARGVPMLKSVAALPGQRVCRFDNVLTIDGLIMGRALDRDRQGRALPVWEGCLSLKGGEIFVMNRWSADSLDGRYFGPLSIKTLVGRADPLWSRSDH